MIRSYQKDFGKCPSYNPNSKRCLLCLNEKYEIATYKGDNLLNQRTEIMNTCKHRSKEEEWKTIQTLVDDRTIVIK